MRPGEKQVRQGGAAEQAVSDTAPASVVLLPPPLQSQFRNAPSPEPTKRNRHKQEAEVNPLVVSGRSHLTRSETFLAPKTGSGPERCPRMIYGDLRMEAQ